MEEDSVNDISDIELNRDMKLQSPLSDKTSLPPLYGRLFLLRFVPSL